MAEFTKYADGFVVLRLTKAEAAGLSACAGEGWEGLSHDPAAAKAYIGTKRDIEAAGRAVDAIGAAASKHTPPNAKDWR